MKLQKTVPARTMTVEFSWCRLFMKYELYRKARERMKMMRAKDRKCWWCSSAFDDDHDVHLACATSPKTGNVLLCSGCAEMAKSNA